MKSGVLGGYSKPMLERDRATIASMLQHYGYKTGAIGKWHLGMELPLLHNDGDTERWDGDPGVDFAGVIKDSPIHHGFDYYFGVTASLDMGPYVYVRNDRFVSLPTLQQPGVNFPHFVRKGPRSEDFVIDECLDRITEEAMAFIQKGFAEDQPCFLYLPLTAPHKPTQPKAEFRGKTGLGEYGDFIAQVDDSIGQVLTAIDESGEADNTLVIFTSDNGSYMFRYDDANQKDHTDDDTIQGYRSTTHTANGPWRGTKADIYEAGHHVPFLVRWPGKITPETKVTGTFCHVDLFATCAEVVGHPLADNEGEDSFSWLPAAQGNNWTRPAPVIHQSGNGTLAIRDGKWKLIASDGSGGREKPVGKRDEGPFRLFDLESEPGEVTDVADSNTKIAQRLTTYLDQLRNLSGSRVWLKQ